MPDPMSRVAEPATFVSVKIGRCFHFFWYGVTEDGTEIRKFGRTPDEAFRRTHSQWRAQHGLDR